MFIIPIGTKSSLALKPKLTIGLIAANVIVALITVPLMIRTESDLFKVQREPLREADPALPARASARGAAHEPLPEPASTNRSRSSRRAKDLQSFQHRAFQIACREPASRRKSSRDTKKRSEQRAKTYYLGLGKRCGLRRMEDSSARGRARSSKEASSTGSASFRAR